MILFSAHTSFNLKRQRELFYFLTDERLQNHIIKI